ncbi:MAG: hypothetical protein B7Z55_16455 [Planctomycetales bacterium 12-60-4]|nr:MAG: hypothetical protein B7Z55_16455 [Planctomycetales bacterium 12-60-4]
MSGFKNSIEFLNPLIPRRRPIDHWQGPGVFRGVKIHGDPHAQGHSCTSVRKHWSNEDRFYDIARGTAVKVRRTSP